MYFSLVVIGMSHTLLCSPGRIDYIHEAGELTGTLLFKFMLSDREGNDLIDQDFFITVMGKSCLVLSGLVLSCLLYRDLVFCLGLSCLASVWLCFVCVWGCGLFLPAAKPCAVVSGLWSIVLSFCLRFSDSEVKDLID